MDAFPRSSYRRLLTIISSPYISRQDYAAYGEEQHRIWAELAERAFAELERQAAREYLDGFTIIGLARDRLPDLEAISACLQPRTGWNATPVSGFLPAPAFFEMLAARRFPTTTWLRGRESLEYTPKPDIFHDVFGHVPMHAHTVFADFLAYYGRVCASTADSRVLEKLGRLFWYTVEFGVIQQQEEIKVYGSGLISSRRELLNLMEGHCAIHDCKSGRAAETVVRGEQFRSGLRDHARGRAASRMWPPLKVAKLPEIKFRICSGMIAGQSM
jgi:phenylalanine-4-hydroxylase